MTAFLPALVLGIPLAAALLALLVPGLRLARALSRGTALALLGLGAWLIALTADGTVLRTSFGMWSEGLGIALRADAFAAGLICLVAFLLLSAGFAADARGIGVRAKFHGRALLMTAAVSGVFLAGDLFNLYVWFELLLVASFALLTLDARRGQVKAMLPYLLASLIASVVLLSAIVLSYGATGTLDLAELARRFQNVPAEKQTLLAGLFGFALAIKSAIVPLGLWLPAAYSAASTPVAMLLSALSGKAALSTWFRLGPSLFGIDTVAPMLIGAIALMTLFVGVLLAVAQGRVRRILGFHSTSQMGYILLGLAFLHPVALAGALLFLLHHAVVKSGLFLCAGYLHAGLGSDRLAKPDGRIASPWLLRGTLLVLALSLAGVPPFSGFLAKLSLVRGGFAAGETAIAIAAILGGILTLLSMLKIWNGTPRALEDADVPRIALCGRGRAALLLHLIPALVAIVFGEALITWGLTAADQLLMMDPDAYLSGDLR